MLGRTITESDTFLGEIKMTLNRKRNVHVVANTNDLTTFMPTISNEKEQFKGAPYSSETQFINEKYFY